MHENHAFWAPLRLQRTWRSASRRPLAEAWAASSSAAAAGGGGAPLQQTPVHALPSATSTPPPNAASSWVSSSTCSAHKQAGSDSAKVHNAGAPRQALVTCGDAGNTDSERSAPLRWAPRRKALRRPEKPPSWAPERAYAAKSMIANARDEMQRARPERPMPPRRPPAAAIRRHALRCVCAHRSRSALVKPSSIGAVSPCG